MLMQNERLTHEHVVGRPYSCSIGCIPGSAKVRYKQRVLKLFLTHLFQLFFFHYRTDMTFCCSCNTTDSVS